MLGLLLWCQLFWTREMSHCCVRTLYRHSFGATAFTSSRAWLLINKPMAWSWMLSHFLADQLLQEPS